MALNKKSVDDFSAKGKRVLVRCDFNVPLKEGKITVEEGKEFLSNYRSGLYGYTYLE